MLKKNAASDRANTNSSSRSLNTQGILGCLTTAEAKDQEAEQPLDALPATTFAQDGVSKQSSAWPPTPAQRAAFSKRELAASREHAAVETLGLLVARNNGCVLPPSHLLQCAYHSIAVTNELSFLRNHIPNTGVSTQVWCFPTPISAAIYLTMSKVTQKMGVGKESSSSPRAFQETAQP